MSESQKATRTEEDDLFKKLEEEINNLRSIQPNLVSDNMNEASFAEVDAEVLAVQLPPFEAKTVAELLGTEDISNENDDAIKTEEKPVYFHNRNKLLQIVESMQKFSLFSKDDAVVRSYANHVATIIGHGEKQANN